MQLLTGVGSAVSGRMASPYLVHDPNDSPTLTDKGMPVIGRE